MGVIEQATGKILAVMVMNAFFDDSAYVHIASNSGRRWATPQVLRGFFTYMFDVRGVSRVIGVTPAQDMVAITAAVKMGFTIEGRIRSTRDGKEANIVSTMFREECPWLDQPQPKGAEDGKT
jgi:RimJ/RimL family protein N-acetyltransferase